jgi:hypothetical protein
MQADRRRRVLRVRRHDRARRGHDQQAVARHGELGRSAGAGVAAEQRQGTRAREIEQQVRATKHWEIDVRRDDGLQETVRSDVAPPYHAGDRVRLVDGRLQPA